MSCVLTLGDPIAHETQPSILPISASSVGSAFTRRFLSSFATGSSRSSKPSFGVVRLTYRDQKSPKQHARSHCGHRIPPFARRLGSEDPQRRSRDEMALKVEGVVDRGMRECCHASPNGRIMKIQGFSGPTGS